MSKSVFKKRLVWNIQIGALIYLATYVIEDQMWETHYSAFIYGTILILWSVIIYFRKGVWTVSIISFLVGSGAIHYELAYHINILPWWTFWLHLLVLLPFISIGFNIFERSEKLEKNARTLFRLASETVNETENGYTDRPYQAGTIEYNEEEMLNFARLLKGTDIAIYDFEKDRIRILFSMTKSPLTYPKSNKISNVTFDISGKMSVYVSENDHRLYKEKLSFDKLCESVSRLFVRYFNYSRNNQTDRILEEIKSVQTVVFV